MSLRQNLGRAQLLPPDFGRVSIRKSNAGTGLPLRDTARPFAFRGGLDVEHFAQTLAGERSERLESDGKIRAELQAYVQYGARTRQIRLRNLPRLAVRNILVAHAGYLHGILERLAETVVLYVLLETLAQGGNLGKGLPVHICQFSRSGHTPFEILVSQHDSAVHEIAEYGDELGIVAGLELFPGEVVVLCLGSVSREHIAQHILLAREVLHILVSPDRPAAGSGNLVAFQIQELVRRHVLRKDESVAVGLEHRREHNAMEHDIVLSYEVHQLGIGALPPLLPIVRQELDGIGDIADGSVEPHIEDLALGAFHGHGDAPVEVAGHGARLQASVKPTLYLTVDIGTPFLVAFQYPFTEPGLIVLQGKIPVGGLFLYRLCAAQFGMWVDELFRAEGGSAFLALVAVGILVAAFGTGAHYVTVGEEGLRLRIVVLFAFLRDELALIVKLAEELRCILLVNLRRSAAVDIEIDAQGLEAVAYYAVILVHYVLRSAALLAGLDGDGHAVLVAAAHIQHILSAKTEIPHINVSRDVHSGKMPDMHRAVGIGQRTSHQGSLELLFHIYT